MGSSFEPVRQTKRRAATMGWGRLPLWAIFFVTVVWADLCPEPVIPNGEVRGEKNENLFFGEISCNIGYHLVGASKTIKCRHGDWSQKELPVCSAIGGCPSLPTKRKKCSLARISQLCLSFQMQSRIQKVW